MSTGAFELEPEVVARGAELLHAQCWLWGQDIRSPQGDLLAASGLERATFEGARSHRSYYRARRAEGAFVVAWGGGLLFGDEAGSLFFPRLRFAPHRLDEVRSFDALPDLNAVHERPAHDPPEDARLLLAALDWLVEYESAIPALAGTSWRAACARLWAETEEGARQVAATVGVRYEPLPPLPDEGLAGSWLELRTRIDG